MSKIVKVHDGERADRRGDVIFIHGIDANCDTAWSCDQRDQASSWPRWFSQQNADLGVWSIDYEADLFDWGRSSMPRGDRAVNLLEQLRVKGLGDRPLIFVTHSMGGLLAKQMLFEQCMPLRQQDILKSTRGVVFLATPHKGSPIASIARLLPLPFFRGKNLPELKVNDAALGELNGRFRDLAAQHGIKIKAFSENQPYKLTIIVPKESANPEIAGVQVIPVDYDHSTICKPPREGNVVSRSVQEFVDECLRARQVARQLPDDQQRLCDAEVEQATEQLVSACVKLDKEIMERFRSLNNFNAKWSKRERDVVAKAVDDFAFKTHWIDTINASLAKLHLALHHRKDVHPDDLNVITSLYDAGTSLLKSLKGYESKVTPFPSLPELAEFLRIVNFSDKEEEIKTVIDRAAQFQELLTPALLRDLNLRLEILRDNHRRRYPDA